MTEVQDFLVKALEIIFEEIEKTAIEMGIIIPKISPIFLPELDCPVNRAFLPITLGKTSAEEDGKDIAKICSLYQHFVQEFQTIECISGDLKSENILELIPELINEECIRKLELEMHNLESVYDTYIKYRFREDKDPRLAHLRNFISIPLLLLETARAWSHFYERHPEVHQKLHETLKTGCVLEFIINWALYYCKEFVTFGKKLAEKILTDYTLKGSVELNIPEKMGFHLRPSTLVAKVVNYYASEVYMIVGEDRFDASSVLSITWAGGKIARDGIKKVTFVGDKRALSDLEILASVNYGEDSMGKDRPLPKELSYLR